MCPNVLSRFVILDAKKDGPGEREGEASEKESSERTAPGGGGTGRGGVSRAPMLI